MSQQDYVDLTPLHGAKSLLTSLTANSKTNRSGCTGRPCAMILTLLANAHICHIKIKARSRQDKTNVSTCETQHVPAAQQPRM